jgi:two-component system, LuxR family, sensor kinase FixL
VNPGLDGALNLDHGDPGVDIAQRGEHGDAGQVERQNENSRPDDEGAQPAEESIMGTSTGSQVTMVTTRKMTRLDRFLEFIEKRRPAVVATAAVLMAAIAFGDWLMPSTSVGVLYLAPILLAAPALRDWQIFAMALVCGVLREAFDPARFSPGATERVLAITSGYALTGWFISALNERRRKLVKHLAELERQIRLRLEAERQVRVLIETSPLAILILDHEGRIAMANVSAQEMLACDDEDLEGSEIERYLPILHRIWRKAGRAEHLRTNVEGTARRKNGEIFLAHAWLSTYRTTLGPGLAAVVWDSSENLRDREDSGFASMMATSRVLVGAIAHEIRNLASAAAAAHTALAAGLRDPENEGYRALGSLIHGLEQIASSGLRAASPREAAVADLGTVLDEVRIVIEPSLKEADIALEWTVPKALPLVQADHHGLLQVFVNLARNSVRALEGCQERRVAVSVAVESDLVAVEFRDSGPGVSNPEELFRPFRSGAQSVGLGLYVSRAILRAHGGGLRYAPGERGSCFTVELWPVENPAEPV